MYYIIFVLLFIIFVLYYFLNLSLSEKKELCTQDVGIYYINLDRSVHRKTAITKQLDNFHITNYKRIVAITPDNIDDINKTRYSNVCSYQTEIEFACLLSHLKSIHTAYINGDYNALILEDDIIIKRMPDFKNLLKTAPKDWEILQLHILNGDVYDKDGDLWLPYTHVNWSTAAYLLNRRGMKNILSNCFTNYTNPDFEKLQINWNLLKNIQPCVSDFVIYHIAKTYSCNDLFFVTPTNESTIHMEHMPIHKYHEDKTMSHFLTHGFRNKNIGYIYQ